MQIVCPTCKKTSEWSVSNQYRPFCSERCKLIDLGAWADGSYAIPDHSASPHDEDYAAEAQEEEED